MTMIKYLFIYTLLFILLICTVSIESCKKYHLLAKSLNSIGFVHIAFMGYSSHDNHRYYYIMFIAFILCFWGDFFLALVKKNANRKIFFTGAGCFLLAHIFFLIALYSLSPLSWKDFIVPLFSLILLKILIDLPDMDTGNWKPYILLYTIFLSRNFSKTLISLLSQGSSIRNLLLCGGAFLFMVSDIIIFFIFFYRKKYKLSHFMNLLTYYLGLLLLSLSLWY